jgi:hypothetical protein
MPCACLDSWSTGSSPSASQAHIRGIVFRPLLFPSSLFRLGLTDGNPIDGNVALRTCALFELTCDFARSSETRNVSRLAKRSSDD